TTILYQYDNVIINNWLYNNFRLYDMEWIISRNSGNSTGSLPIYKNGNINGENVLNSYATRPTFYLNNSIILVSGEGREQNPYRIS
ncbi:MAG: hypothetical protein RSF02_03145, partial [Bacilli bacterium]